MNVFKMQDKNVYSRQEQRNEQRRPNDNSPEFIFGQTFTKRVIEITEADRMERRNGRQKNALRTGIFALVGSKVIAETVDALSGNFGFDENIRTNEMNGGLVAASVVVLYGLSRLARYRQNVHHQKGMSAREAIRGDMAERGDEAENSIAIANGSINAIGDFYNTRIVPDTEIGDNNYTSSRFDIFLYDNEPTISRPNDAHASQPTGLAE